jgi:thioesterase domain-containing protein
MPTSKTIEILTAIWCRVLQRSQIGVEENFFFDLDGDPVAANRIFAEIARECGRELSPLTIYQAPTIAGLTAVLEEPAPPRFPTLVKLKAGAEVPGIFMVPGLCSSVMEFFKVVKHIDSPRPVYGMQCRGIDGIDEPFDRIEDMARFYLDAIQVQQPHGPYIFIGYSFGGLVALEMAQRLSENGEKIGLLVMIETYPHRDHVPLGQSAGIFIRRVKRRVSKILCRVGLQTQVPEDAGEQKPDLPEVGEKFIPVMRRACLQGFVAFGHYCPRHYKGRINFLKATKRLHVLPNDPNVVWSKLADDLLVETAPGGHWGIITTQFESLAAILSRYVKTIPN